MTRVHASSEARWSSLAISGRSQSFCPIWCNPRTCYWQDGHSRTLHFAGWPLEHLVTIPPPREAYRPTGHIHTHTYSAHSCLLRTLHRLCMQQTIRPTMRNMRDLVLNKPKLMTHFLVLFSVVNMYSGPLIPHPRPFCDRSMRLISRSASTSKSI